METAVSQEAHVHIVTFLHGGLALAGQIKTRAEDFVVIELAPDGAQVSLSGPLHDVLPAEAPLTKAPRHAERAVAEGTCADDGDPLTPSVNLLETDADELLAAPPARLVGALGLDAATRLWAKAREHSGLRSGSDADFRAVQVSNSDLGKPERARVHDAVQRCLPALRTEVRQDGAIFAVPHPALAELRALLPDAQCHSILAFEVEVTHRRTELAHGAPKSLLVPEPNREQRASLHGLLRRSFATLEAETMRADGMGKGAGLLLTAARPRHKRRRGAAGEKVEQGTAGAGREGHGEYLHFVLQKAGVDSHAATRLVARALGLAPAAITLAGTKDKHALTRQRAAARGVRGDAASLRRAAAELAPRRISLGSPRWAHCPLQLGELAGNQFHVVVRRCRAAAAAAAAPKGGNARAADEAEERARAAVASGLAAVASSGFVNYFGLQRFGRSHGRGCEAHAVGARILARDWAGAVRLLIGHARGGAESAAVAAIRARWREASQAPPGAQPDATSGARLQAAAAREALRSLAALPRAQAERLSTERALLKCLEQHGDCRLAITALGYSRSGLFVEAYVSLLWNELATLRLQHYGTQWAVPGDTVLRRRGEQRGGGGDGALGQPSAEAPCRHAAAPAAPATMSALHAADVEVWDADGKAVPPVAAGADAHACRLPLWEVALQLPGKHASYSLSALAQRFADRLSADGLEPASLPPAVRFRALVVRPTAVRAEWLTADADLGAAGQSSDWGDLPRPRVSPEDLPAVRLSFRLPPAAFATMLLREVLSCPSDELEPFDAEPTDSVGEDPGADDDNAAE